MAAAGGLWADRALELRVWLRLLSCTNRVLHHLRRNLKETFRTTLPRFDLLAQVARPPLGPSPGELSRRLLVTKGNISDIVARLEKEALIERRPDAADGRMQHVYLTGRGEDLLADMLVAHNGWLTELMRHMSEDDLNTLFDALGRLDKALKRVEGRDADMAEMDEDLTGSG